MQNCKADLDLRRKPSLISYGSDTVGDKICLFGFSRGAYTARALAGMLNKVRQAA